MKRIALDLMGSDKGPEELIIAVNSFLDKYKDVTFYAVGKKENIECLKDKCELVYADDVLGMEDGALEVMRKKEASMLKAVSLVAEGKADAVVSAGSTGGFISSCSIKLKLVEGIERAALVSPFPKANGDRVILLDIGANNENTFSHLVNFAKMGRVFASLYLDKKDLKIYLLSNGAEEKKGSPVVKEAHQLLKNSNFKGFKGNMEARYVMNGDADVVVCGGYEGNVFLKGSEGAIKLFSSLLKDAFKSSLFSKIGYLFCRNGLKKMKQTVDYKNYGGAILLGVNGVAVKAHGSSDARCFESAIKLAYQMLDLEMMNKLKEDVKNV